MSLIATIIRPKADSGLKDPAMWLVEALGGKPTSSGVRVNARTSMTLSAYYACQRNISEDVGKLPLKVIEQLEPRGKRVRKDHYLYPILHDAPNPLMRSMTFRETLTHWAMGWGGGLAEIQRDPMGRVAALWPIHPDRVKIHHRDRGDMFYEIRVGDAGEGVDTVMLRKEDVFHLRGLSHNGVNGYSVLEHASESLGLGLAAQRFGAAFFGNNTAIGGILQHPESLSEQARENIRSSFQKDYGGSENVGKVMVAEEGMTFKPTGIPPEQAQFLETRGFQVPEICRWFRMPPHKVQDLERSTFSNIEHQSIEYVTDTLDPWLVRWEQEIKGKLIRADEPELEAEHTVNALLRGDSKTRGEFYTKQFQVGALSSNDIRELEGRNPVQGGDAYYRPLNLGPLDAPDERRESTAPPPGRRSDADLAKKAAARIIASDAERLLTKEKRGAAQAAKKPGTFGAWADRFYTLHRRCIVDTLTPVLESLAELLSGSPLDPGGAAAITTLATVYAQQHVEQSKRELADAAADGSVADLCGVWLVSRPSEITDRLIEETEALAATLAEDVA